MDFASSASEEVRGTEYIGTGAGDGILIPVHPEVMADPARKAALFAGSGGQQKITLSQNVLPATQVGLHYAALIQVANGSIPYAWSYTELPAGLIATPVTTPGSQGLLISGIPAKAGALGFTVTVSDAAGWHDQHDFVLVVSPSLWASEIDLASLDLGFGLTHTRTEAAGFRKALGAAFVKAGTLAQPCRMWYSGSDPATPIPLLIDGRDGGRMLYNNKCPIVDLNNVAITPFDMQALQAPNTSWDVIVHEHLPAPVLNTRVMGNGANQYHSDPNRTTGAKHGAVYNGIVVHECGFDNCATLIGPMGKIHGFRGHLVSYETRGVTGATAKADPGQLVGLSKTVHERAIECFTVVVHGCGGGDQFVYEGGYPDLSKFDVNSEGPCANSGPKIHFTQREGGNNKPAPLTVITIGPAGYTGQRHGPGTHGSGPVQVRFAPGAKGTKTKHWMNFESGAEDMIEGGGSKYSATHNPPGRGVGHTPQVIVGDPNVTDYDQVWSEDNGEGFHMSMSGSAHGFEQGIDVYGFHSLHDEVAIDGDGTPAHIAFHGATVDEPKHAVHNLGSATASKFRVNSNGKNPSRRHLVAPAKEAAGAPEVPAQVAFTDYPGGD